MRNKLNMMPGRRRSGAALIWVIITMTVMMGFCSLAVDLGRYEVAHAQLYNAAVAAARAGAAKMTSSSTASTAAIAVATSNTVDGQLLPSSAVTVQWVNWSTTTNSGTIETTANFSQANAVKVTITYTVPLAFAQVLGYSSKTAVEYSTAMVSIQTATPYVYANGDPWLAGEPTGTTGSQSDPNYAGAGVNLDHPFANDVAGPNGSEYIAGSNGSTYGTLGASGTYIPAYSYKNGSGWSAETVNVPAQPYSSPIQVGFTVTPGATITITNVSGSSSYDSGNAPYLDATGNQGSNPYIVDDAAANSVSEHGIADATMPAGSMNAVFLGSSLPDNNTAPTPLDFSTQSERDYVGLQPKIQQPFYVGEGQTSGGTQQQIVVPSNATRLFLGVMDGWEWDNNIGGFNCTVTQTRIITVQ